MYIYFTLLPCKSCISFAGEHKSSSSSLASRNLWVSGLSASTRAADLKTLFSKHGKVINITLLVHLMRMQRQSLMLSSAMNDKAWVAKY